MQGKWLFLNTFQFSFAMKRAANRSASQGSGACFQQLEGLPLRLIALKCSNPGPLAASCTAAHRSISTGGDFEVEWFLRWVHVLAPLRPWQYAAVCWHRLGGTAATAEQLCSFILRVCDALRDQQVELSKQVSSKSPLAAQSSPTHLASSSNMPEQQQQQQQEQQLPQQQQQQQGPVQPGAPEPDIDATVRSVQRQKRSRFGTFPLCLPSRGVTQQARRLLSKGKAITALPKLFPGEAVLLYHYIALAGNLPLLQQLVAAQSENRSIPYPCDCMMMSAGGGRTLNTAQMCAYAAMQRGHSAVLAWVLFTGGATIKSRRYQVGQLFRFACRHSTAACIQQLQDFVPCMDYNGCLRLQPWPQHLAMAAARVDPWAAGVVQHLLQSMSPKLLAAKYMGPVYTAACRTGHMPVLQQLLQVAAAAPQQHLPVLLKAAAAAGNLNVWQHLLVPQQDLEPSSNSGAGGSDPTAGPVGAADISSSTSSRVLQAPAADSSGGCGSSSSSSKRWLSLFSRWFSQPSAGSSSMATSIQQSSQQQQQQAEARASAASNAYPQLPWHFVGARTCAAALLVVLNSMCRAGLPRSISQESIKLTAEPDRVAMADQLWELLGERGLQAAVRINVQELLSADVFPWASYGKVQSLLCDAVPGKVAWLLQHQMLPDLPPGWQVAPDAFDGLHNMIRFSLDYKQRQTAASLLRLAQQLQVQVPAHLLVQGCVDAAVRAAARAQDLPALHRILVFAEYHDTLQGFAAAARVFTTTAWAKSEAEQLLLALTCAWNAAVVQDIRGRVAEIGMPLRQNLRLCASVIAQACPQAPGAIPAGDMLLCFDRVLGEHSTCAQQGQEEQRVEQLMERLQLFLQSLDPQQGQQQEAQTERSQQQQVQQQAGQHQEAQHVYNSAVQQRLDMLPGLWQHWLEHGPQELLLPCKVGLTALPLPRQYTSQGKASGDAAPGCSRVAEGMSTVLFPGRVSVHLSELVGYSPLFEAVTGGRHQAGPISAVSSSTAWEMTKECSSLPAAAAAAAEEEEAVQAAAGAGATQPDTATVPTGLDLRKLCTDATLGACVFLKAHQPPVVLADGDQATAAGKAIATAARSAAAAQGTIMPLWQLAALALAGSEAVHFRADPDVACEAVLQPTSWSATAAPSFLADTTPGALQSASPVPPPEHRTLTYILGAPEWQRRSFCHWPGSTHRLDAAAWVLHPQQEHLWANSSERWFASMFLRSCTTGLLVSQRTLVPFGSLLVQQVEQQLREHRQQRAAGVTDGFMPLPQFAAAAANVATTLILKTDPVQVSDLVRRLSGQCSGAVVEHVKCMVAAALAAYTKQLQAYLPGDLDWLPVSISAVRKAQDIGDMDLLTLLVLLDQRAWALQPPATLFLAPQHD